MGQPFLYQLARQLTFRVSSREMGEILEDYRQFSADLDFSQTAGDVVRALDLPKKRARGYAALAALVLLANWWLLGWFVPHSGHAALRWAVPLGLGLLLPVLLFFTAGKKAGLLAAHYRSTAFDRVFQVAVCCLSGLLLSSCLTGHYPRFQLELLAAWIGPSWLGSLHRVLTGFVGAAALLCVWFFLSRGWKYYFPACCAGAAFYMLCAIYFLSSNMNLPPNISDSLAYYGAETRRYSLWAFAAVAISVVCVWSSRRKRRTDA